MNVVDETDRWVSINLPCTYFIVNDRDENILFSYDIILELVRSLHITEKFKRYEYNGRNSLFVLFPMFFKILPRPNGFVWCNNNSTRSYLHISFFEGNFVILLE